MKSKIGKSEMDVIKSLAAPPAAVKSVLTATMLLLGNEEHVAKNYRQVQKQLASAGPQALPNRMSQVNVDLIPVEVAQLARQWHWDLSPDVIKKACFAAVAFFSWNQEVIESVLARSGQEDTGTTKPQTSAAST